MLAILMLIGSPLTFAFVFAFLISAYLAKRLPTTLGPRLLIVLSCLVAIGIGGFVGLILGVQSNRLFDYTVLSEALGGAELFRFADSGLPRPTPQGASYLNFTAAGLLALSFGFAGRALIPLLKDRGYQKPMAEAELGWIEEKVAGSDTDVAYVRNPDKAPRESGHELL